MYHVPIMVAKVLEGLAIKEGGTYLDCTFGGGGHSAEILGAKVGVKLIGLDKDLDALKEGEKLKSQYPNQLTLVHGDYSNVKNILDNLGVEKLDGVLMDLGISSHQIDEAERGFSYVNDAPLDMRMDRTASCTAEKIVNTYSESELLHILHAYGEEPFARSIVARILKERAISPIRTTLQLSRITEACVPSRLRFKQGHPAKRTFQAIRIAVNGELVTLERTINDLVERLAPNGRIVVLTFHSLEDRITKQTLRLLATDCICDKSLPMCICHHVASVKLITTKPVISSEAEIALNSRAAPAKLRIAEKV